MPINIAEKLFSFSKYMFFEVISVKFRPGSAKTLIDFLYVVFEKIAVKFDIISSYYFMMYQELVDKEIKMVGISPEDKVIVVGCGSLPITAVIVAKKTQAHVTAIDKDETAVKKKHYTISKIIILKIGLKLNMLM